MWWRGAQGRKGAVDQVRSVSKIISGGQTGADRAGLDVAIELGIPYGGYVPRGRRAEDGRVPDRYEHLVELESHAYPVRTRKNVMEADGTVIFYRNRMGRGTRLTAQVCEELEKLYIPVDLDMVFLNRWDEQARRIDHNELINLTWFIQRLRGRVINVAGSRESSQPGIYHDTCSVLREVLTEAKCNA